MQITDIGMIPTDWSIVSFSEILNGKIKHGIYKSKKYYDDKGVKILKMGVMYSNTRINDQDMEKVLVSNNELSRYKIEVGDLIFSRTSMMAGGAGKVSIVEDHIEPIIFDGNLLCARLDKNKVNPEFYFYFFQSINAKNEISKITTGTQSRNIAGSNLEDSD